MGKGEWDWKESLHKEITSDKEEKTVNSIPIFCLSVFLIAYVEVDTASVNSHYYYLDYSAFHYYWVTHYVEEITLEKDRESEAKTVFEVR